MTAARLAAHWVAAGYGVPDVCSRHGEPAAARRPVRIVSRPPGWAYALMVMPLVFGIVALSLQKSVRVPGWPFCARCGQAKVRWLVTGFAVLVAGVLCWLLPVAAGAGAAVTGLGGSVALGLLVAALILLSRAKALAIAGAQTSLDGVWVLVPRAHPAFAEWAARALTGTPQYPPR